MTLFLLDISMGIDVYGTHKSIELGVQLEGDVAESYELKSYPADNNARIYHLSAVGIFEVIGTLYGDDIGKYMCTRAIQIIIFSLRHFLNLDG